MINELKFELENNSYRKVIAGVDIEHKDTIMFVPKHKLITLQKAEQSDLGLLLKNANLGPENDR